MFPFTEKDLKTFLKDKLHFPFVLLETAQFDDENNRSIFFFPIEDVITFTPYDKADDFFRKIEEYLKRGFYLAGYFSYEFGYFLESWFKDTMDVHLNYPLVWLGACKCPQIIEHRKYIPSFGEGEGSYFYQIKNLKPNITPIEYRKKIEKIKKYLKEGETYQVNFTFKFKFNFYGDLVAFYLDLRRAQPTPFLAFINTGNIYFLSFSPELFFRKKANLVITKPMKGTTNRGRYPHEDRENILKFVKEEKVIAENLMIVDLLRNDLGRIAEKGKVWVENLFSPEVYRTIIQMTSTVKAILKKGIKFHRIFTSLFPSGSVTGAPKIRTMEIIKELEKEERGIYTGAIGYFSPYKDATFNVAIRTIVVSKTQGELGVGGGILYDSLSRSEFKEAKLKANFLSKKFPRFWVIETILWQGAFYLLELHLQRLKKSCNYFTIPLNEKKLIQEIFSLQSNFEEGKRYRVRAKVNLEGKIELDYQILEEIKLPVKVKLSKKRIDPEDKFLYHKTTIRRFYDEERRIALREGFFEVIFLNCYNQVCEGAITNIFLLRKGNMFTPPIECGLLPGILREKLIEEKKVKEKVIFLNDLLEAEKVFVGNSVRGLMEVDRLVLSEEISATLFLEKLNC